MKIFRILSQEGWKLQDLADREIMGRFLAKISHSGLLGTMLGFGRENSWLFHRYAATDPKNRPMISAWAKEEIPHLTSLQGRDIWSVDDIFYPRYPCDPLSEETDRLRTIYRLDRENIVKYFSEKEIVGAVLSLFTQS